MKYIRFDDGREIGYARLDGDTVFELKGCFLDCKDNFSGRKFPLSDVKLLAPIEAPNILCIGLNYNSHASETSMKLPQIPLVFIKATTALCGPSDSIVLPKIAPTNVDYEGELAVVIGKKAKNVSETDALDYVFGYSIANDVSARDCQLRIDGQWARGKSFDTFCPIGPAIVTGIFPGKLQIQTKLNNRIMQSSNTEDMIFSVPKLVSFCSKNMTLLPGTIILTGTPEGVGFSRNPPVFLKKGDRVEISIEHIGTLCNTVVEEGEH